MFRPCRCPLRPRSPGAQSRGAVPPPGRRVQRRATDDQRCDVARPSSGPGAGGRVLGLARFSQPPTLASA
eukprot:1793569-Alexandrium_andersonii.AAC.1